MDKLQAWLKYKEPILPFHQQRTLEHLKKTLLYKPLSEKIIGNNKENKK